MKDFWVRPSKIQPGTMSLVSGTGILVLLALGFLVSWDIERREEVSTLLLPLELRPNKQPPFNPLLQRILSEVGVCEKQGRPEAGPQLGQFTLDGSSFNNPSTGSSACIQYDSLLVIRSRPITTATVGREFRYKPEAIGDVVAWSVSGSGFLAFDEESSEIRGTPGTGQIGLESVTVRADLSDGRTVTQGFDLMVSPQYHFLGTDRNGRDLVTRMIIGTRFALLPGVVATLVGVLLGLFLGAHAGYYGGTLESVIRRGTSAIEAVPAMLLIILAVVLTQFNLYAVMVVVGLVVLPEITRTITDRVSVFRERQFVEAARELGLKDRSILWREIVWYNLRPVLVAQVARTFSLAILMEVSLSYFGFGDEKGESWGALLLQGKQSLGTDPVMPWMLVFPALAIVTAVSGFRLIEAGIFRRYGRRPGA